MDLKGYLTEIKKDKFCSDIRDEIVTAFEKLIQEIEEKGGVPGTDGRGIVSFEKTNTNGLVDTYTITYTDNTKTIFQITNGGSGGSGETPSSGLDVKYDEETGDLSITSSGSSSPGTDTDVEAIWEGEY